MDRELDAELRRLFADERLDLPVRADAEVVIVAGARRVRRRRRLTATAGVLMVAVLVGSGIAVAANGHRESLPPAEPTTTTTTTTTTGTTRAPTRETVPSREEPPEQTVDPPPPLTDATLTRSGYGPFGLGTSTDDALATRLLTLLAPGGNCARYTISGGGEVVLSDRFGVVEVTVPERVRTPEGLGAGSTVGEVRAAYPWAWDHRDGLSAEVTEGADARYQFVTVEVVPPAGEPVPETHVVGRLALVSHANDCALAL
ncbi:MAG TPA: hypothetical protein VHH15_10060 [Actinophytocola sp.]|nr:hypothetical protein [Actinophytocola sp.]